ncbi:uncharacterized protein N7473_000367 [Penicillium subrubescens]|uniref:Pathogen-related protein n=1 Tax=Penicillium subrubescens TaxID=1316194 RepID=A0A1Q5TUB3_9EURO|nr:uncharacterized protein N7473_000367 [Penicillium subrubescens]KAJ5911064.1 hypothetical protein N7473_000367 [Penicillium subrubescens]OKP03826.1 Pathogen-related protein [Penicillium subrubescens]
MANEQTLPDFVLDDNAVLKDDEASWRYGKAPDYSKTRAFYQETKTMSHEAKSLPDLVEKLVKNWEIEASFKTSLDDWRTIDRKTYTFSLNGGEPQSGEHMLKVGTYNALLTSSSYYDPINNDFETSHKAFKRMMPTFAWEVKEVYSGPPVVIFKWRHWGYMVNDYIGNNDRGESVKIKAHGGLIDIVGIVIAKVNEGLQLEKIDVWYDPMDMMRQIAREHKGEAVDASAATSGCPVLAGSRPASE